MKTAVWVQSRQCHICSTSEQLLQRQLHHIFFSDVTAPGSPSANPSLLICSGLLLDQTNLPSIYLLYPWVLISKLRIVKAIPHLLAASFLVLFVLGQISERSHKTFMSNAFLVSHQTTRIYCFHVPSLIFNSRAGSLS